MKLIIKKSLIIFFYIFSLILPTNSFSINKNIDDFGVIAIMYHRFNENKYPSTNIRMNEFKQYLELIKKEY